MHCKSYYETTKLNAIAGRLSYVYNFRVAADCQMLNKEWQNQYFIWDDFLKIQGDSKKGEQNYWYKER